MEFVAWFKAWLPAVQKESSGKNAGRYLTASRIFDVMNLFKGERSHAIESRSRLHGPRESGNPVHRLSKARARLTEVPYHGVILKIVQHQYLRQRPSYMVRAAGPRALSARILGHEITGEVLEAGRDVEFIKVGDLCSVPFNIACGRCRNCKEGRTGICLNVNPARPGAAYGYVDMGGWIGGQAEYVMVPYADFNLLKFPDKDKAMAKIKDLTLAPRTSFRPLPRRGMTPASRRAPQSTLPARDW